MAVDRDILYLAHSVCCSVKIKRDTLQVLKIIKSKQIVCFKATTTNVFCSLLIFYF